MKIKDNQKEFAKSFSNQLNKKVLTISPDNHYKLGQDISYLKEANVSKYQSPASDVGMKSLKESCTAKKVVGGAESGFAI
jgi:hypothetical protein